jgi:hypothetical protein
MTLFRRFGELDFLKRFRNWTFRLLTKFFSFKGWWANEFNLLLSKDFGVTEKIPAVFIDSFHNVENDFEVNKFRENVEKLRLFAETRYPAF